MLVGFSPDGSRVATAGADPAVKLWRTGSKADAVTLPGHADQVTCLAFSPDGARLASGARDGAILLHHVSIDALLTLAEKAIPRTLSEEEAARYAAAEG
jgi:WD40 repeat protein